MANIVQIGMYLIIMETPTIYNFSFSSEVEIEEITRLTNQIWKLIPMRENNEDWLKQLDTVIIRVAGLNKIFNSDWRFLDLLAALEGIKEKEELISFSFYRKTIFECISLLQGLKENV